jgi:drug/metabolite transporter (DMT)-like permease
MLTATAAAATAAFAQTLTSLYPIIIKRVDTNILTQTAVRFVLYPILAIVLGGLPALASVTNSPGKLWTIVGVGALNLVHVFSSYIAFDELQAGIAMSIFYLYPLLNMVGSRIFFGEPIALWALPLFALALIGTYLVASAAPEARAYKHSADPGRSPVRGIVAALMAALTETGLYLAVRGSTTDNGFANMIMLYLGGAALLIAGLPIFNAARQKLDLRISTLAPIAGFNTFIGFVGTTLMFYSARFLPAYMYSILAFIGVAAAYGWGMLFANEQPNKKAVLGAGTVLTAVSLLYSMRPGV